MYFSLVKRDLRGGVFSWGSIARVHPLFVFKYFLDWLKSDDITTFASSLLLRGIFRKKYEV